MPVMGRERGIHHIGTVIGALTLLGLAACGSPSSSEPTPTLVPISQSASTTTSVAKTSTAPSTSKAPTSPRTTTSSPPSPVTFTVKCYTGNTYPDYRDAWPAQHTFTDCYGSEKSGVEYSPQQRQAFEATETTDSDSIDFVLGGLYEMCAARGDTSVGNYFVAQSNEARKARAELILCPDHPDAAAIQAAIDEYEGRQVAISSGAAAAVSRSAAADAGLYAGQGSHLVGIDIQPGTWRSVGDRVENCYWEISDSSGGIIDNAAVSVAPPLTITIPATAAGFTATGCSFERIGD